MIDPAKEMREFSDGLRELLQEIAVGPSPEKLKASGIVELPNGEVGMELDGQVYEIKKSKPWEEMTEEERSEWLEAGTRFIMGE